MGTKASPSVYDCYQRAEPDEPMFVLLARDPVAEYLVIAWAALRSRDLATALQMMHVADFALQQSSKTILHAGSEKVLEARQCAKDMRDWRLDKTLAALEARLNPLNPKETE